MANLVIDSSVAAAWCFQEEATSYTEGVLSTVAAADEALAPRLWAYEVRNSALLGVRRGRVTRTDARVFLESLHELRIRLADPVSYDRIYDVADRHGLTIYDGACLELAAREGLPLATLDKALIRAAAESGVAIFQP